MAKREASQRKLDDHFPVVFVPLGARQAIGATGSPLHGDLAGVGLEEESSVRLQRRRTEGRITEPFE